ncbi:MAG: hypothetical protein A2X81_19645 [Desulfobacterales bacterium GWB2_56_26]|nr:MAG: hypothetical protein A2X81_19645 [Desulfobacterales bacterium GWB2_56_26]
MTRILQTRTGWSRRKFFVFLGSLTLIYPICRFAAFHVPKKPVLINISKPILTGGYFVASDFVLFDRGDSVWALSRKCTHLGCKLTYHEDRDIFECPCHQSQFHAETGEAIRGPATKPLAFFPVEKRASDPFYVVTT